MYNYEIKHSVTVAVHFRTCLQLVSRLRISGGYFHSVTVAIHLNTCLQLVPRLRISGGYFHSNTVAVQFSTCLYLVSRLQISGGYFHFPCLRHDPHTDHCTTHIIRYCLLTIFMQAMCRHYVSVNNFKDICTINIVHMC